MIRGNSKLLVLGHWAKFTLHLKKLILEGTCVIELTIPEDWRVTNMLMLFLIVVMLSVHKSSIHAVLTAGLLQTLWFTDVFKTSNVFVERREF